MSDVEPAAAADQHQRQRRDHKRDDGDDDDDAEGGGGGGCTTYRRSGAGQVDMGGIVDDHDDHDGRHSGSGGGGAGGGRAASSCCLSAALQLALSTPGLVVLVVAYSVLGALIFPVLEAPVEQPLATGVVLNSREECLKELWTITERLNVLYERNWTMLVHEQLRRFEGSIVAATRGGLIESGAEAGPRWTFSEALLYSVTVITTIGHGNLTPRTSEGKVVTMLYALIGVPLMLMCLSSLGGFLAEALQCSYGRLCGGVGRRRSAHGRDGEDDTVGDDAAAVHGSSARRTNGCGVDVTRATKTGGGVVHHHIKHNGDAELNCNVCTQYDAVYSKDSFEPDRDDSCCLIRQSPAKSMAMASPPSSSPASRLQHHRSAAAASLNNTATAPAAAFHNATLPRDMSAAVGGGGDKHNLNQMHLYHHQQLPPQKHQQQQQQHLDSCAAQPGGPNHRSANANVYFTMTRMQMSNAQHPPPPLPHPYPPFGPPVQFSCASIPPPASFATTQPRYALMQQMATVAGAAPSPVHNYPMTTTSMAMATATTAAAATTSAAASSSMQLQSNFENNEYRIVQQHPSTMPMMPMMPMMQAMHQPHHQQQQQQHNHQHQHHTATVHGLGRSKFLPKPMPPEINNILQADGGGGGGGGIGGCCDASASCPHDAQHHSDSQTAAMMATTTTMPTSALSPKYGAAATMSSLETLDDDDDDDPRNGCPHGTPSRIPLIRQHQQRSKAPKSSATATKIDAEMGADNAATADVGHDELSVRSYGAPTSPQVPITVILIILLGYIGIGTAIFALWENWSLVDGAYFCFVTLSTIGFGDLVPTRTFHGPEIQLFACCVYLVLGLVLVAMSFSLLETQLLWKCRRMAVRLKLTAD